MSSGHKKTVVITGTSTGIGEDTARFLAKNNWTVYAGVRKDSDAEKLRSFDSNIRPLIVDVTNQDQVNAAFEQVRKEVGAAGLDALVNNAGLAIFGPTEFIPMEDVKRQYEINVFGVVRVTQAAMPLLRMGTPGRVINIGSVAPAMNMPLGGMYCASKGSIDSVTESFRREVMKWGIKVILIKPGPVKTQFGETALNQAQSVREKSPEGSECLNLYGTTLDRYPEMIKKFEKQIAPVSKCTSVIYKALNSSNPRNKYYDTWGSYFTVMMINITPSFIFDRMISSMMS